MDPLKRYTFKEAVSNQELHRDPIHTTKMIDPPQDGKDSLKCVQQDPFCLIQSEEKYKMSKILKEGKKRSREISECHPQPTRVDSANDIHPRRNKCLPSSNKPTNSTFLTSYNKPQNTAPLARLDKNSNSLSPLTSRKITLQTLCQGSVGYRPESREENFAA